MNVASVCYVQEFNTYQNEALQLRTLSISKRWEKGVRGTTEVVFCDETPLNYKESIRFNRQKTDVTHTHRYLHTLSHTGRTHMWTIHFKTLELFNKNFTFLTRFLFSAWNEKMTRAIFLTSFFTKEKHFVFQSFYFCI